MRVLVIGLGSMGKRRVRNLLAIGGHAVAGYDPRADRRAESEAKYGILVHADIEAAFRASAPEALVISTPPQHHMTYAWMGLERGLSCFIEASVVDAQRILALHHRTVGTPIVMAPSCTMRFFPGPKKVRDLVREGAIGRPLNINYQSGQFLPDWHPWERVEDYYVSRRETGGGREIVPFELTWLNDVFGAPQPLACVRAKLTDINADIDDVYHCLLRYPGGVLANVTVEVISRPQATRELRVLGTEGELVFSSDEQCVRYARVGAPDWVRFALGGGTVEDGYINPEEPYIAELRAFLSAVERGDSRLFPNSLLDDYRVLQTLERLEALSDGIQ